MTNYSRGTQFEYRVRDYLKERGYTFIMRSAGSHGAVDIAAFKKQDHLAIQCKTGRAKTDADKWNELLSISSDFGFRPILAIRPRGSKKMVFYEITGPYIDGTKNKTEIQL